MAESADERIARLEAEQRALKARVDRLEAGLGAAAPGAQPEAAPSAGSWLRVPERPAEPAVPARTAPASWEFRLGGQWLAIVGVVLLVLGVVWFLLLAFDRGWITPEMRVYLGVVAGAALWLGGVWLDRRGDLSVYGQLVSAAGAGVVYFALYAAAHFDGYRQIMGWSTELSSVNLGIVAALLLADALWRRTQWLAGMSVALVAITVVAGQEWAAFSVYYTVLFTAVLVLAAGLRGWNAVQIAAQPLVFLLLLLFLEDGVDGVTVLVGLAVLLALFTFLAFLPQRIAGPADARRGFTQGFAWVAAWGIAAFAFVELAWWSGHGALLTGLMAVAALALALLPLASAAPRWGWGVSGLVLLTLWVLFQFGDVWIPLAWTALLTLLLVVGAWKRSVPVYAMATALALVVTLRVWVVEGPEMDLGLQGVGPVTLLVAAAAVVMLAGWIMGYLRPGRLYGLPSAPLHWVHLGSALLLGLVYLGFLLEGAWITLAWALEAVIVLAAGALSRRAELRWIGLGLFVPVLVRVLFIDLDGRDPVWRVLSFLGVGAVLLVVAFMYARAQRARRHDGARVTSDAGAPR